MDVPAPSVTRRSGLSVFWEGFWEGFAANRCKGMQRNENGRASNHVSLQRFAKESSEKQKLAKNLKTAGSKPLGVRVPRPPLNAGTVFTEPAFSRQAREPARISGRHLPAATLADCVESPALRKELRDSAPISWTHPWTHRGTQGTRERLPDSNPRPPACKARRRGAACASEGAACPC